MTTAAGASETLVLATGLVGGGLDGILTGTGADETLIGGGGADVVFGGAGDDTLIGEPGDDTYDGGTGTDTLDYSSATGGMLVDLVAGTAVGDADAGENVFTNIESFRTGSGDDTLLGGAGDDTLDGGDGSDFIDGNAGNDRVVFNVGGNGLDILDGGTGDDTLAVELTGEQFAGAGVGAELLALRDFVNENADAGLSDGPTASFEILGLEIANFEHVDIRVDGTTADLDAAQPVMNVEAVSGEEDSSIPFNIHAALNDTDGSETLSVTIFDLPDGATIVSGHRERRRFRYPDPGRTRWVDHCPCGEQRRFLCCECCGGSGGDSHRCDDAGRDGSAGDGVAGPRRAESGGRSGADRTVAAGAV